MAGTRSHSDSDSRKPVRGFICQSSQGFQTCLASDVKSVDLWIEVHILAGSEYVFVIVALCFSPTLMGSAERWGAFLMQQ